LIEETASIFSPMRLAVFFFFAFALATHAQEPLGGTTPLTEDGDFSSRMVRGISQWLDRETARIAVERTQRWREAATGGEWRAFAETQREKLRRALGAVDPRRSGAIEEVTEMGAAAPAAMAAGYTMHRVRWPVFDGVNGEGVLLRPVEAPRRCVIVVPDADELPEVSPLAHQLAAQGCLVLVPALVDRRDTWSGSEALQRFTNQPHREWIARQAFEMGRTLIGYEVQKILAAIDPLTAPGGGLRAPGQIAIAGDGEGALLALYAAAIDERIDAALIAGYFGPREGIFAEPLYRNVFGLLLDFGDAELAALIAPRPLLIAHTRIREISGGKLGRRDALAAQRVRGLERLQSRSAAQDWKGILDEQGHDMLLRAGGRHRKASEKRDDRAEKFHVGGGFGAALTLADGSISLPGEEFASAK